MSLGGKVYNLIFKRSSTYFLTLVVGAFAMERVVDRFSDNLFNSINHGKQWSDIQHLAVKAEDAE